MWLAFTEECAGWKTLSLVPRRGVCSGRQQYLDATPTDIEAFEGCGLRPVAAVVTQPYIAPG